MLQKEDQQKQFFKWSYFHKRSCDYEVLKTWRFSRERSQNANIVWANKAVFSNLVKQHKERGGLLSGQIMSFSPVLLPDVTYFMEIASCRVFGYAAWSLWHKATGKAQRSNTQQFPLLDFWDGAKPNLLLLSHKCTACWSKHLSTTSDKAADDRKHFTCLATLGYRSEAAVCTGSGICQMPSNPPHNNWPMPAETRETI